MTELAMAVCTAAFMMRSVVDCLNRRRKARLLSELDWVREGIDLEALLDE